MTIMEVIGYGKSFAIVSDIPVSGELEDADWYWGISGWEKPSRGDAALDSPNYPERFETRAEAEQRRITLSAPPKN